MWTVDSNQCRFCTKIRLGLSNIVFPINVILNRILLSIKSVEKCFYVFILHQALPQMKNFTLRVVLDGHLEGSGGAAEDPGAALSVLHSFENILNLRYVWNQFKTAGVRPPPARGHSLSCMCSPSPSCIPSAPQRPPGPQSSALWWAGLSSSGIPNLKNAFKYLKI